MLRFIIFSAVILLAESSSLRLVQLLYRHGDRTPSHTFPTDPYRYHWTRGVEMLTQLGMRQHFRLGQYLRARYKDFLPEEYKFNDTLIRSTDNDRTILSALSQLHGLYPKTYAAQDGYPFTELIPIHTVPKQYDQVMKMTSPCPSYKRLWKAMQRSPLWDKLEDENRDFFDRMAAASGFSYVGLVRAFYIADVVTVWLAHNLTMPAWVTPDVVQRLESVLGLKQYLRYYTPEMARLRGGPLLGVMANRMVGKVSGSALERRRLLYSYSAHDSTLAAFLSVLRVFNRRKPPYVACVIVELHRSGSGEGLEDHFVRIFYRNDTRKEPLLLQLPDCVQDCPLSAFLQLTKDRVPLDIHAECFAADKGSIFSLSHTFVSLHPFLVTAAVLAASLGLFCCRRKFSRRSRCV